MSNKKKKRAAPRKPPALSPAARNALVLENTLMLECQECAELIFKVAILTGPNDSPIALLCPCGWTMKIGYASPQVRNDVRALQARNRAERIPRSNDAH